MADADPADDREIGVNGNGRDEAAAGQVTGRDEPALGPARRGPDDNGIFGEPSDVEQKGRGLVHVCKQEVVDEKQELVGRVSPPRQRVVCLAVLAGELLLIVVGEEAVDAEGKVDGPRERLAVTGGCSRGLWRGLRRGIAGALSSCWPRCAGAGPGRRGRTGRRVEETPCHQLVGEICEEGGGGGKGDEGEDGDGDEAVSHAAREGTDALSSLLEEAHVRHGVDSMLLSRS